MQRTALQVHFPAVSQCRDGAEMELQALQLTATHMQWSINQQSCARYLGTLPLFSIKRSCTEAYLTE